MSRATSQRATFAAILLCFFLSGAAGLIYQVAWGKALGLVFGHTVYAIATVLAVFMGGLALGSAWLGRWCETRAPSTALYGWIELGVAATGALSLAGMAGVRAIYVALHPSAGSSSAAMLALRFLGAALVLLLPTFLMGGTLPVLVRALARSPAEFAGRVARLYWVNTAGAVAGTLAAGFLLIPRVGLRETVGIAVALNVAAGFLAIALGAQKGEQTSETHEPAAAGAAVEPHERSRSLKFLLAGFALVGATAIVYEIAWTRMLATIVGSSTYAFTLMLATFLAGIVLGSQLFELWHARGGAPRVSTFAATQTLIALAALGFLAAYGQLPRVVPAILQSARESFRALLAAQLATSALAMLPAAIVFGFNFPAVVAILAARSNAGRAVIVGRAYAANTLGAITGAVLAGFWLVPRLGAFRVVAIAAAANLLLALALELRSDSAFARRVSGVAASAALLAAAWWIGASGAFYNRAVATFATALYWDLYEGKLTVAETAATTDILFAEDGLNASISVARTEDYLALRTNGKVDASNRDQGTQLLVGHLGAALHPAPRRVLVIGFGSGMTVSTLVRYPDVERVDCVEIEPAVLHAARFLEPLNRGVLRDARVHVILDDARNYLLTTREQYDLIISEPSNPWIAGVAALFTDEYYAAARARLRPGGMFVQWVQAYCLYPEDLRMVLATFVPHFPRVTVWHGDSPDLLLMAQTDARPLSFARLRGLWNVPQLQEDYRTLGMRAAEGITAFFILDDDELRRVAASATERNTDDRTLLEYRAPRALLARGLETKNRDMLQQYQKFPVPRDLPLEERVPALLAAAETMLNQDDNAEAERFLSHLIGVHSNARLEILRGRLALAHEHLTEAQNYFQNALRLDPQLMEAAEGLAETARRRAEISTAEVLLQQVLARKPDSIAAMNTMMLLERGRQNWDAAVEWQRKRIAAERAPSHELFCTLGDLYRELKDDAHAEAAFASALERDPYSYCAHRELAALARDHKNPQSELAHLEFIVQYFPDTNPSVYTFLAEIYRSAGRARDAENLLRKGRRIFPEDPVLRGTLPIP